MEHRFHTSPTVDQHDTIAAIELALADDEAMFAHPLVDTCPADPDPGELLPVLTIVTDNGGLLPVAELPTVHHHPPRAEACAHEGPHAGTERVRRPRVRDTET